MQVLKEDIRSRILTVARQQFERKGYVKTSMREIAELAGVGVGNIYNYFTSMKWSVLFCALWKPCCKNTTAYGAKIL